MRTAAVFNRTSECGAIGGVVTVPVAEYSGPEQFEKPELLA